ncbi:chromosome segregation protein SMC [Idiomarina sp.]|uniref:chromosome segregation protein SMC n=1 Tax=Idiomarina sp. TaxID=1874361 RepID=UPI0025C3B7E8|nr:chromosome segregation protein SMC [Idiomarina sp.]NQZ04200.1 chromosome segregation protein SMC [Idiomarina sp.]
MRLKHIKLAGFKSFVDATKVPFPDQMTCVVGPNGCGKSNVIDAVRWVLGESSAKNLRGDAMTDVIFNGSNARKPVSQASVELVFDNTSGRIQGEFASYNEISVKRQVSRDGQSNYFLNNSKCRRRDITDLFLGTGLGPRSYAIIEQGMISRLIESKPQELRVFIEEAAGISKYKERRKETENRILHTRENLERISDVREELGQQLQKLQRQAAAAQRYKELKAQERDLRALLLSSRWWQLNEKQDQLREQRNHYRLELDRWQTEQTGDEKGVISLREQAEELKQRVEQAQQAVYECNHQIVRIEQAMQHQRQLEQQREARVAQLNQEREQLTEHDAEDNQSAQRLTQKIAELEPGLEQLEAQLEMATTRHDEAREQLQRIEQDEEQTRRRLREVEQQKQRNELALQQAEHTISHSRETLAELAEQRVQVHQQTQAVGIAQQQEKLTDTRAQLDRSESELMNATESYEAVQRELQTCHEQLQGLQREQHSQQTRAELLREWLAGEDGSVNAHVRQWAKDNQLRSLPEILDVEPAWRDAVEAWLSPWLNSYWSEDNALLDSLPKGAMLSRPEPAITFPHGVTGLVDVVSGSVREWPLVQRCLVADTVNDGQRLLRQCPQAIAALTKAGDIVLPGLVHRAGEQNKQGLLHKQAELAQLEQNQQVIEAQISEMVETYDRFAQQLDEAKSAKQQVEQTHNTLREAWVRAQQQLENAEQQYQRFESTLLQLADKEAQIQSRLESAEQQAALCESTADELELQLEQLQTELNQSQRASVEQHQRECEQQAQSVRTQLDQHRLQLTSAQEQHAQLQRMSERQSQRLQAIELELRELAEQKTESKEPQQAQLEDLLAQREERSETLQQARDELAQIEQDIHELSQGRSQLQLKIDRTQQALQGIDIEHAKLDERTQGVLEQLSQTQKTLKEVLPRLHEAVDAGSSMSQLEQTYSQQLERTTQQIGRLGAINLAAIEEAETQKQRKDYLDEQYDDLSSALETLEAAIQKIDRETRQRFKATFDAVNGDLQKLFPKVFGGGSASLELTDSDLLETGVTIMAQPPGKKNSTIHLLSGGEKALTALSLVFAIFRLNPAPFCLLDEVDAPLDDANVGRFCRLVQEMSETVQFIYISHNKVAMEMATHLAGVTMQEAGVSRLVAVDIEQAVAMTEA